MAVKGAASAGGAGTAASAGGAGTAASAGGAMAASGGAGTVAASGKGDALDDDPGTSNRGGQGVAVEGGLGAVLEIRSASSVAGSGHGAATAVAPGLVADADVAAGSASGATSSAWPEGMDPKSTYLLKLRLVGNPKKARKEIRCFSADNRLWSRSQFSADLYYSIEKFGAAYAQLIPAMPDKTQWPESDHGFFMHPSLLKATAGRPKTERYKGCSDKKRKSGKHLCPICNDYGHHWPSCKKGNPEDIAAMMAVRGPPKKRIKTTQATESAIVPCVDGAPSRMCFPPSQNLDITTKKGKDVNSSAGALKCQSLENSSSKKKKGGNSGSGGSKRSKISSNQPDQVSIQLAIPSEKKKGTAKKKKKELADVIPTVPLDSPAMGTRSKKFIPSSPAMSTRSRRRLSL